MKVLTGKTILILSPQSWGKMFVSKHHYAVELAKAGNDVYFLNPPAKNLSKRVQVSMHSDIRGLYIIDHKLWFPYALKFHANSVFQWLMKGQVEAILKKIHKPVNVIWSFDLGNLYPFKFFPESAIKVFHPVDEPMNSLAIQSAHGADIIFSVTREILEKYEHYNVPRYFINHGVNEEFLRLSEPKEHSGPLRIGLAGNLIRKDIDRQTLLNIVGNHPEYDFYFWGNYDLSSSNTGGDDDLQTRNFVDSLKNFSHVKLFGPVSPSDLAREYEKVDAFLICYDINKDQSRGTNYHKVLEFISTGKLVISNNITTYASQPDLVQMTISRDSNDQLSELLSDCLSNLKFWNSPEKIRIRKEFAQDNSYHRQLERIDEKLSQIR